MITVLHRGGYAQMITILHRGEGSLGTPKSDYVICARPPRRMSLFWNSVFSVEWWNTLVDWHRLCTCDDLINFSRLQRHVYCLQNLMCHSTVTTIAVYTQRPFSGPSILLQENKSLWYVQYLQFLLPSPLYNVFGPWTFLISYLQEEDGWEAMLPCSWDRRSLPDTTLNSSTSPWPLGSNGRATTGGDGEGPPLRIHHGS